MKKCPIHPKYKGKKKPKMTDNKDCKCAELFLLFKNKPRILPLPTKIIKDKSKYDRKRNKPKDN